MTELFSEKLERLGFKKKDSPGDVYRGSPSKPKLAGKFFADDFQTGQEFGLTAYDERGDYWCYDGYIDLQEAGFEEIKEARMTKISC